MCVTGTDFITELLTGANSCNKKLYDHKIKLKKLISKIDQLSIPNYTILEDSKTSEENLIFSNELKDTSNYLILRGNQFIDRATTMEIVASNCPNSVQDNSVSEDNDLIYVSMEQLTCDTKLEDDKKKIQSKFIPFKKEKTPSRLSSSSSENEAETIESNEIPAFKHRHLKKAGREESMCAQSAKSPFQLN